MEAVPETPSPDADSGPETITRSCLMCSDAFPSAWAGERICKKCKSTSAWREG